MSNEDLPIRLSALPSSSELASSAQPLSLVRLTIFGGEVKTLRQRLWWCCLFANRDVPWYLPSPDRNPRA